MFTSNQSELSWSGRKDCQILLICQDEQWELTNGPTRFALAPLVSHLVSAHFSAPPLFFFWLYHTACGILVPWPGMEPMPPYWEHRTLNPGLQRSPWRVWEVHNLLMCLHAHMLSCFSRDQLWKTNLRTVAHQAPPSMGFSRQEYWTGVPFLPPGDLPYPGIKPSSPALADRLFTTRATWEAPIWVY